MSDSNIPEIVNKKKDAIVFKGTIATILPNNKFKVQINNGPAVLAHTSGKMRANRIRVLQYDVVDVEVSTADLHNLNNPNIMVNARITYRYKN